MKIEEIKEKGIYILCSNYDEFYKVTLNFRNGDGTNNSKSWYENKTTDNTIMLGIKYSDRMCNYDDMLYPDITNNAFNNTTILFKNVDEFKENKELNLIYY